MCQGEGCLENLIPGGYYNHHDQSFYPFSQLTECPECQGAGTIEVASQDLELESDLENDQEAAFEIIWERAA
jgi:RecJ-like exonuclease